MNTHTNTQPQALLYARISVTDQRTPKVANQLSDLRALATREGYANACEYRDDGIAASKPDLRDDFNRLMADLPKHPGAVILATEEARLARNMQEKLALQVLCAEHGITWHTVRDGKVNPSEAAGEFMALIRGAVDTLESKRKGERQRARAAHDRAQGLPYRNSPRPFGREDDHVTERRAEADLIRLARDMLLRDGKSLFAVMTAWQKAGSTTPKGNAWTAASVRHAMRKWSNAAVPTYGDEPLPDVQAHPSWTPIISRDDAEEIRALLALRSRPGTGVTTLCGGIIRCRCGAPMVGGGWQGRNSGRRIYRCSFYTDNKINLTNSKGQHSTVARHLADHAAREAVITTYLFRPSASNAASGEAARLADMQTELTDVQAKIGNLLDLHLEGELSKAIFQSRKAPLATREAELAERISQMAAASANARMLTKTRRALFSRRTLPLSAAAEVKRELGDIFDGMGLEDQRALLAATAHVVVGAGQGMSRFTVTGEGLPTEDDDSYSNAQEG
ncbi:recombinase family protein [uncultured Jatrophihabitans sp.]|uniref:recombinase family protein n=1 Tax=uncultured Jatrophihabitans sp. TaxID=1610747 RepID=UPI0035CBB81A